MTTILESTTAGIAYLRGGALVRCNRRFETMLRLPPSAVVGSSLAELLAGHPRPRRRRAEIREALHRRRRLRDRVRVHRLRRPAACRHADRRSARQPLVAPRLRWYALSVRRAGGALGFDEAIAVLSDVTRMKPQQVELETLALERELIGRSARASILDSVLVGIVTVGRRGIEWMNRSARRHVRRRAGRFRRRADGGGRDRRRRPSVSPHALPRRAGRRRGRDLRVPVCARDGREFWVVGNVVATGREDSGPRSSPSRCSTSSAGARPRRRCRQAQASLRRSSRPRRWRSPCSTRARLQVVQFNDGRRGDGPARRPTACSASRSRRCCRAHLGRRAAQRHAARAALRAR